MAVREPRTAGDYDDRTTAAVRTHRLNLFSRHF